MTNKPNRGSGGMALDGYVKPMSEGYLRKGGQNAAPAANAPRPPAPPPFRPNQSPARSGEYEIRGPRGGHTGQERTVVRGEPLPPRRPVGG